MPKSLSHSYLIDYLALLILSWSIPVDMHSMQSLKYLVAKKVGEQLLQNPAQRAQILHKLPQELHDTIKQVLAYTYQVPLIIKLTHSDPNFEVPVEIIYGDSLEDVMLFISDYPHISLEQLLGKLDNHCLIGQTSSLDNNFYITDLKTTQCLIFSGHTNTILCGIISNDGKYALTGSQDTTARLWTIPTGQSLVLSAHTHSVNDVYLSPDNKQVITGSEDTTVRLWDITQAQPSCTAILKHNAPVQKLCVNRNGKLLIAALNDGSIWVWNIQQTPPSLLLTLNQNYLQHITAITINDDNRFILVGSYDGYSMLWDPYLESVLIFKDTDTIITKNYFIQLRQEDIPQCLVTYCADHKLYIYDIPKLFSSLSLEEIITLIQQN